MKTTSVSYFASGNQVLNTQLTRKLSEEFLDSQRYSEDLRLEGNGIGEAYMYNKQPVEGYVYLDAYYLEKRGEEYATILCTEEVEGTLEEVENALLEYYLANEGYKAQAIENRLELEGHQEKVSFYRATLALESDVFEAFAPTKQEARSFLISGLEKYGEKHNLGSYWFEHYLGLVQIDSVAFGDCLRKENI